MNIIMLRGLIRESGHWGQFTEKMKESFPDFNIITPDIQGVGVNNNITSPNNFDDMITFMRKTYMKQIESSDLNIIMAISLGGMIAKRWSELYPKDFQKMILINTSYKGVNSLFHRIKPWAASQFIKVFLTKSVEARENRIVKMVCNTQSLYDKTIQSWIKIQHERPVNKKSYINQIKAALTFSPSKEKFQIPVKILASKADRLCSYKSSIKIQQVWGGELSLHEQAGHDIPLDAPDWLIKNIKEFTENV